MGTPQTNTLQSGHWFCTPRHKLDPPYPEAITMVGLDGRYKAYLFISSSIVRIRLLLGCYAVAWFLCLQFFNHQWWRKCFVRLFLNGVTKFSWVLDINKYLSICRLGEKTRPLTSSFRFTEAWWLYGSFPFLYTVLCIFVEYCKVFWAARVR